MSPSWPVATLPPVAVGSTGPIPPLPVAVPVQFTVGLRGEMSPEAGFAAGWGFTVGRTSTGFPGRVVGTVVVPAGGAAWTQSAAPATAMDKARMVFMG